MANHFESLLLPHGRKELCHSVLPALIDCVGDIAKTLRRSQHVTLAGTENVFGDDQLNIDISSESLVRATLAKCASVTTASSEEDPVERPVHNDANLAQKTPLEEQYTVAFDPLDGSSIIAPNWSVGTIIGIWDGKSALGQDPSAKQIAAVIGVYGPRTTAFIALRVPGAEPTCVEIGIGGVGAQGYEILRPRVEFSAAPYKTRYFAPANLRAAAESDKYLQLVTHFIQSKYTLRYSGGLVPDIVHALVKGHGIYVSPVTLESRAKLRRLYELYPISLVVECAGGVSISASDGKSMLARPLESCDEREGTDTSFTKSTSRERKTGPVTQPTSRYADSLAASCTVPRHIHSTAWQRRDTLHPHSRTANEQAAGGATMDIQDRIMNKVENQEGKRGGGPRKSRGGRGGGSGSRSSDVSRALSRLLRHQAENAGIKLDGEGYAPLDKVLQWGPLKSLGVTLADVQDVVATNEKQRFSLKPASPTSPSSTSPGDYLIRANQGHSIKLASASLLEPLTLAAGNVPARVVHGTYYAFWEPIVAAGGLRVMGRNHIHCAVGTPDEGVVSGMRRDAQLLIEIDVARSIEAGIAWWRSDNGVILTEGDANGLLGVEFFQRVQGREASVGVLWENGAVVAELPPDVKRTVPNGKGPRGGGGGRGRGGRGRGGGRADSGRGGHHE